jgi:hypothetical protein
MTFREWCEAWGPAAMIVAVAVMFGIISCLSTTAPAAEICPVLSDVNRLPGGGTVRTWAYFKHDSAGPTYAAMLVYDDYGFRPPCLRFTP